MIDKRAVAKEELIIGRRVVEDQQTVEAEVRLEEFDVDENADVTGRKRG